MALSLILEDGTGLETSNAYETVAGADAYFERHLYRSDWTDASSATKTAALVWATELLDYHVDWVGAKQDRDQALAWPRAGGVDHEGFAIDSDLVPEIVKRATAELARYLIIENRTLEHDTRGFSFLTAGSLQLTPNPADRTVVLPDSVLAMVRRLGTANSSSQQLFAKLVRT